MHRLVCLFVALVLAACGSRAVATSPTVTPTPTVESRSTPTASPTGGGSGSQDTVLGPAGMTLQQEVGAVMMVGFKGPLTPAVLEDWRQHQFGGLIVLPINQNAGDAAAIRQLIQSVRGVMLHPLMAATNSELATTSSGLKALGFDINLAPVADGLDRRLGTQDVAAAVASIHAAGMYAVADHFPGNGNPDFGPFKAAIAAHVEFILVGHLNVPSIDASAPTSMSAAALRILRSELGYQGVIISDDLQMGALLPQYPPPSAAVRFLKSGGDMVIVSDDIAVADATYAAIHAAVLNGSYPRARLDASVQKLLSLGLRFMP